MPEPIISAQGLTKTFWRRTERRGMLGAMRGLVDRGGTEVSAVDSVSFDVTAGEIVGYIGPNGAGKSTTIKMLTGILVPSGGEARVAGHVPWEERRHLAQKIGVVFGQRTQLWWDLPLSESLELLRYMYKVPEGRFRQNLQQATDLLDLGPFWTTPVRQLSLGQRMRGDLAAALLHEPPILYLDEPTIGLDLVAKTRIREFLAELNRSTGVTILLTTHDLADIERLCRRIVVIDHGRIVHDGELARLRDQYSNQRRLTIDYDDVPDMLASIRQEDIVLIDQDGPRVRVAFDRSRRSAPDVLAVMSGYGTIRDMSIEEPAIEDVIQNLYAGFAPSTS
jgi:ABC-2 type transport system ATP-binding protein